MEFRVLGPLEIVVDGQHLRISSGRQRALLVILLVRANRVVGFDELVEAVWGDSVPVHPRSAVHTCVTRLRNTLGGVPVIESRPDGYRIVVDEAAVDLGRFETAMRTGEAEALRAALDLWRGDLFADVRSDYLHREVAPRLVERRLDALERRIDLDLEAERYDVSELSALTAAHPLRERFWAQLITALYRSGRQADALLAYSTVRRRLVEELGIEPGIELRRAHKAVLAGESSGSWSAVCQLPIDIADFAGRDGEVTQLLDLLRLNSAVPVVTISGSPGVGKSALAIKAAHHLVADYPDGQWFLRLNGGSGSPRVAADLLGELLRTAGVHPAAIPADLDERAGLLRSRLADRKVLLVLDDAANVEQVAPLLPGRPGCAVLVTSRSDLAGISVLYGGSRVPLEPLSPQHAYELLARIVGTGRCGEDEAASVELTNLCGRLPLALRIVAANLASRPGLQISRYATDLRTGDRLAKLRTRGAGGIAVRAAFDVSYVALGDSERRAFCLLGLAPGPDIGAEGAAALFGCSFDDAVDVLDRLVGANLLEYQSGDRFRFHDLTRVYAADRAREDLPKRDEALRRLFDWYLYGAHAAVTQCLASLYISQLEQAPIDIRPSTFDTDDEALEWLDAERENYLAVIEHAATEGPARYSWQLTDAVRPDLHHRYQTDELERSAKRGFRCALSAGNRRGEAMMLLALGGLKSITGRYDESVADLSDCGRIAEQIGETGVAATAVISMAGTYIEAGQPGKGARAAKDGMKLVERGAEQGEGRKVAALIQLGSAYFAIGHLRQSAESLESALSRIRPGESAMTRLVTHGRLGRVYYETGDYEQSVTHFELGLDSRVFRHGSYQESGVGLAASYCATGRLDLAWEHASAALDRTRQFGYKKYEASAAVVLGWISLLKGETTAALGYYTHSWELARELDARSIEIEALTGMALSGGGAGFAEDAFALARKQGMRLLEAKALNALAWVRLDEGRVGDARESAELALDLHRQCGCPLGEGQALTVLGHVSEGESALSRWREALAVFEAIGSPLAAGVRSLLGDRDVKVR